MQAGKMRSLVAFESAAVINDGGGAVTGEFAEVFRTAAEIVFQRGGETVVGQRLQGVQPAVIKIRDCAAARAINAAWRARDVRTGQTFNIRAVTPTDRRNGIDFLCETGRPDGNESHRPGEASP